MKLFIFKLLFLFGVIIETIIFIVSCTEGFSLAIGKLPALLMDWFVFFVLDDVDKNINSLFDSSFNNKLSHNKYEKDIESLQLQNKELKKELDELKALLKNKEN